MVLWLQNDDVVTPLLESWSWKARKYRAELQVKAHSPPKCMVPLFMSGHPLFRDSQNRHISSFKFRRKWLGPHHYIVTWNPIFSPPQMVHCFVKSNNPFIFHGCGWNKRSSHVGRRQNTHKLLNTAEPQV